MDSAPPIIEAATAGDVPRLRRLLEVEPAAVNTKGWMNITPLIAAVWFADSADAVRLLLERGADPLARRTTGDNALHWAASGAVAELLVAAAGPRGMEVRYHFDATPLHIAVDKGRREVVRVLLATGADPFAAGEGGLVPLDTAADPEIVRMLVEAGAPVESERAWTPLHGACARARTEDSWVDTANLLLDRGADPGRRDRFGDTPIDVLGDRGPEALRARMIAAMHDSGRSVDLTLDDVATGAHEGIAVDPRRPVALTTMYSGAVLVEWRLTPTVEPVRVIRVPGRVARRGLNGSSTGGVVALVGGDSVHLREWRDLARGAELPAKLLPGRGIQEAVWSPDGRLLAISRSEGLTIVDMWARAVVGDAADLIECELGDWSVVPRFSPDGTLLAVANSTQGHWWQTMFDVLPAPSLRYEAENLPSTRRSDLVGALTFSPDGQLVATWVRPDAGVSGADGYRGLVVVREAKSGEPWWHRHIDDGIDVFHDESYWAPLCFTDDGTALAVGLDRGVMWFDAETGERVGMDVTEGAVTALTRPPRGGLLAATTRGVRWVAPPFPE
ncbi:hypothetical protein HLB23_12360 [Nocardia uniformis]|uniref:Uncharacterized protein n=1 Tax=Nocardia uniformis TaxID=53432 RepID=A0A849C4D2_9NOCA|nr:ankyrin repeat domain-containing protein [Nocardia uniformis]NNH70647.1 hypothetical protein [Nocardia uniformis]